MWTAEIHSKRGISSYLHSLQVRDLNLIERNDHERRLSKLHKSIGGGLDRQADALEIGGEIEVQRSTFSAYFLRRAGTQSSTK